MVREYYFIDTNIFMYARGKLHKYRDPCASLILAVADGSFIQTKGIPVIDTELFQEVLYRYAHVNEWDTAVAVCSDIRKLGMKILPVRRQEIDRMIELADKYSHLKIAPRDIVHLSVMVNTGVGKIISVDTHFDLFEEVERIDPLAMRVSKGSSRP